jgi:hydrogenase maturation protease
MNGRLLAGIGHPGAGDDAVGWVVAARWPTEARGWTVRATADPVAVVPDMATAARIVVVDAVTGQGWRPGGLVWLRPGIVADLGAARASTHDFGVAWALRLAEILYPGVIARTRIAGVALPPGAASVGTALSASLAWAVPRIQVFIRRQEEAGLMHERLLMQSLVEEASAQVPAGAGRVRRVRATVADTEQMDPATLALHFADLARGTPVDGAVLEVAVRAVAWRCVRCGHEWQADAPPDACPECGGACLPTEAEGLWLEEIEWDADS